MGLKIVDDKLTTVIDNTDAVKSKDYPQGTKTTATDHGENPDGSRGVYLLSLKNGEYDSTHVDNSMEYKDGKLSVVR